MVASVPELTIRTFSIDGTSSFTFSAIAISTKEVGIDVEKNREKIKIIQHKFVNFEKGFIRAEVIAYDDYVTFGSEAKVKEAGKMRVEGKEYVVKDGDVMHFRFNV